MQITKINPFSHLETVEEIATIYQQSFGSEPWNEGYSCPLCEKTFAFTHANKFCSACAAQSQFVLLIEYWPKHKVLSDFYREMQKAHSICIVAQIETKAVGFTWGYRISADPNIDLHLDAPGLHKHIQGDFFYLDECAIIPSHQGRGIGKLLITRMLDEQKEGRILLRTMDKSRMCNLITHLGGEIVQHISRNRVIMQLITT